MDNMEVYTLIDLHRFPNGIGKKSMSTYQTRFEWMEISTLIIHKCLQ